MDHKKIIDTFETYHKQTVAKNTHPKFYTNVEDWYMFVPNFFQIFSKCYHNFLILKNIPGAYAPGSQNAPF